MTKLTREDVLQALADNARKLRAAKLQRYATPPGLPAPSLAQDMTKKQKLAVIWRRTHRDYKGMSNGVRSIMLTRNGMLTNMPLDELTDSEIERRLPA